MKLTSIAISGLFLLALSHPAHALPVRPCNASQLREAKAEAPEGGAGNEAAEVAVTNVSRRNCTLDGVPQLTFLDGHGRPVTLRICANCSGYVFHAAPPQTVTLAPGGSAHFLIGFYNGGYPGSPSADVSHIQVAFADHPLRFALFGGDTFAISGPYITAWQPGIYRDPAH